jgi:hypothetical protein
MYRGPSGVYFPGAPIGRLFVRINRRYFGDYRI